MSEVEALEGPDEPPIERALRLLRESRALLEEMAKENGYEIEDRSHMSLEERLAAMRKEREELKKLRDDEEGADE